MEKNVKLTIEVHVDEVVVLFLQGLNPRSPQQKLPAPMVHYDLQ